MNKEHQIDDLLDQALSNLRELEISGQSDVEKALKSIRELQSYREELRSQSEDLKQKQKELTTAQQLYFQYFDMAPIPIFRVNEKGVIQQCNLKASEVFQVDRQKLNTSESRILLKSLEGREFNRFQSCLEKAIEVNSTISVNLEITINGEMEFFRFEAMPVRQGAVDVNDSGVQIILYLTELTEYRNRDMELRKMEAALDQNPAAIFMTLPDGRFHYVNPRFEELYGYCLEDIKDKTPRLLKSGLQDKKFFKQMWTTLKAGNIWKGEIINRAANSSKVVVRAIIFPIFDHNSKIAYYIAVQEDVTAEKQSRESLDLYSGFAEVVNFSVVFTNPQREVSWVNPAFERLTGYTLSEVMGKNLKNVLQGPETDPVHLEKMHEALAAHRPHECEIINYNKSGEKYWIQLQIAPIHDEKGEVKHFISIQNEVTERKELERQINRKQRMESIGSLAGGMAHDINNLLQPISLGVHQLKNSQGLADSDNNEVLDMMQESVDKAAGTIRQILTFARGGDAEHNVINILPVVKQANRLARETVPRQIEIEFTAEEKAFHVRIAPTQMTQVMMNLVLNARDALKEKNKGKIRINLTSEDPTFPPSATVMGEVPEGEAVWIEISDNGCGIPLDKQAEVFEPFYSTKTVDQGTGMGLATTYGIVKNIGGCLALLSDGQSGTTFTLGLPLSDSPELEKDGKEVSRTTAVAASQSEAHIVVVDDEKAIGHSLGTVFEAKGYQVQVYNDPLKALDWFSDKENQADLLLIDYMMPGMDGIELIQRVRKDRPDLPVILMTGLQDAEAEKRFEEADVTEVLNKPFDVNRLLSCVQNKLE